MFEDSPLFDCFKSPNGPRVGIAFRRRGIAFGLGQHERFHAASMMKVPIMFEAFRQDSSGRRRLDSAVLIRNRFTSILDGSEFSLDAESDSDKSLYSRIGTEAAVRELVEIMITNSGNLATNILIEELGVERVREFTRELGAEGVDVIRGVEDGKAYAAGLNNTMTAAGYLTLMDRLAAGDVVSSEASQEMIQILTRQLHNEAIPTGLPPGTIVAHKTGWNTDLYHDGGIVFEGDEPTFTIAVFTQGTASKEAGEALVAEIAGRIWRS